jgi:hypothetical protein
MKYTIRKTSPTTARIAIESSPSLDPARKPEIWRFYPSGGGIASLSTGMVLGRKPGKTCALIVHVRPHDLIAIREKLLGVKGESWKYFRIAGNFHPQILSLPDRCITMKESIALLQIKDTNELDQIDFKEGLLRSFLAQRHPHWLQQIVDRQLRHWRDTKPESFFRLAPRAVIASELPRCVEVAPIPALAHYKNQLNKHQLASCIRRCSKAAVMFAFDNIPSSKRRDYVIDNAKEALECALEKLSDEEFRLCAYINPWTAFHRRERMAPKRRAITLAYFYPYAFVHDFGGSLANFQQEALISLLRFPEQWRACDPKGFPSILKGLQVHLGIKFNKFAFNVLLEKVAPEDRQEVANFFASFI